MRDTLERLRDIEEAITLITKYTNQGRDVFEQNELIRAWVVRHLEIIGEAARSVPQDFRDAHPEIPWKQVIGMRNILIHAYFGIDHDVIWDVVEHDLSGLKTSIDAILQGQ